MVDKRSAVIGSLISSTLIGLVHGATHYTVEGASSINDPGVMAAGTAVFISAFLLIYLGMQRVLPW